MMHFSAITPSVTIMNLALMAIFWAKLYTAHPVSEPYMHQPVQSAIELTSATKNISSPSHLMSYSIDLLPPPSPPAAIPPTSRAIQNASLTMPNEAIVNVQSPATAVFNTLRADGTYAFGYKTPDGQSRTENTLPDGTTLGSYEYRTPEGNLVTINYSAGRHGFVTSSHGSNIVFANAERNRHLLAASAGPNNSIPESTASNYQHAISGEISHNPFPVFQGFQNLSDRENGDYFGDRASSNRQSSNQFVTSGASNPVAKSEVLAIPRIPLQSSSNNPFINGRSENVASGAFSNSVATSVGSINFLGSDSVATSGESNYSEGIVDAFATSAQSLPAVLYSEGNPPSSHAARNPPIASKRTNFMTTSEGSAASVTSSPSLFDGRPTSPASTHVYSYSINSNPAGSRQLAVSSDRSVSSSLSSSSSSSSSSFDNNEAGGVKQTTTSSGLPISSAPIWVYARSGGVPQQVAHQPSSVPFGHWHANSAPLADDVSTYQESTGATSGLKVAADALSTSSKPFPFGFAYGSNPADIQLQQYLS